MKETYVYSKKAGIKIPEFGLEFQDKPLRVSEKIAKELVKGSVYIEYFKGKPLPEKKEETKAKKIKSSFVKYTEKEEKK